MPPKERKIAIMGFRSVGKTAVQCSLDKLIIIINININTILLRLCSQLLLVITIGQY